MGWETDLFAFLDELEQEAGAAFGRERAGEVADRGRAEYRAVTLASRLMASLGAEVSVDVRGVGQVGGVLRRVGDGWCLVEAPGCDWVLQLAAVDVLRGASERSVPESAWSVADRLGTGSVLRRLADAYEPCVLHLVGGARHEGVVTRVGADFLEVTYGVRAARAGVRTQLVALGGLAAVQSAPHLAG
ncbi:hypothetical protein RDV89_17610 [Nocardioides zeae]|uniref:Fis family transcriptional regulator n=1 Tax=Nocardioides imazamoxiresistens TaxID=3231893 RepID=A0ABU3Q0B0_9ACTN|nr:hypothetical protein [Nocardioides zeae]MDT9594910.1 hypothetical protein [Nocardioides zeae]